MCTYTDSVKEEVNAAWFMHQILKRVVYSNKPDQWEKLEARGYKRTGETYAVYWLLDNGYKYYTGDEIVPEIC